MNGSDFNKVLSLVKQERLRPSTSRGELIESESDKGRVINSASFRRLQQKAQVFPLDSNAAVRTRLTHSVEVSQVGRHIAQKVIELADAKDAGYHKLSAFVNTVETACLLHDIGNPPFGHLGESAVREWFQEKFRAKVLPENDLVDFDGNPQGFRLMAVLAGADSFGFNLTATQLLSTIKYPWAQNGKPEGKKIGLFDGEVDRYLAACEAVGWKPFKPFPLMRLMDVADEIAYSMSDLEDGLEKKIISLNQLTNAFDEELFKDSKGRVSFLTFKIRVINMAVEAASKSFVSNIDAALSGDELSLLDKKSEIGDLLKKVKGFAFDNIYSDDSAEKVELAGRSVIKGLLNHFGGLLELPFDCFDALLKNNRDMIKSRHLDFHARLFRRLPDGYISKYQEAEASDELYRRAHLIVDFVSGMTDDFALEVYQILEGIRIK